MSPGELRFAWDEILRKFPRSLFPVNRLSLNHRQWRSHCALMYVKDESSLFARAGNARFETMKRQVSSFLLC